MYILLADVPRMEKSPLLANGYNHPPTHLSHMQFMQLGGHPGAGHTAILSPASLPHHLQAQAQARAEQGLKVNPNMTNMEALARSVSRRANTTNRQRKSVETVSGVLTLGPGTSLQDNVLGHFQSAVDARFPSGTVWENCRAAYEDIVKHLERLREERGDAERALALDHKPRDLSSHNGSSNGHSPVLNLSKTAGSGSVGEQSGSEAGASHRSQDDEEEDDNLSEDLEDDNEKDEDLSDVPENLPLPAPGSESPPQALNYSQIASAAVAVSQSAQDPSVSSTETLLRNIQGLLKVAADNARQQERQINYEKARRLLLVGLTDSARAFDAKISMQRESIGRPGKGVEEEEEEVVEDKGCCCGGPLTRSTCLYRRGTKNRHRCSSKKSETRESYVGDLEAFIYPLASYLDSGFVIR
ncbi:Dachshund like protein 2 [Trachymyrmex zeteki]|uniref:Dachshund like protein 2 n=1 Tax=Mycetomoellerius zeteki TaxID=64791 RepID=A0A151XCB3_9HYME|nr:Dachshund like protein 2 [Trachymyrmex zeteki]